MGSLGSRRRPWSSSEACVAVLVAACGGDVVVSSGAGGDTGSPDVTSTSASGAGGRGAGGAGTGTFVATGGPAATSVSGSTSSGASEETCGVPFPVGTLSCNVATDPLTGHCILICSDDASNSYAVECRASTAQCACAYNGEDVCACALDGYSCPPWDPAGVGNCCPDPWQLR